MSDKDIKHLEWVYERMKFVHNENENLDYMIRFREILASLQQSDISGRLRLRDLQYLEAELKRRQDLIQSEPEGIVRETMIDNLLDGLFRPSKIATELGFEYEMFFKSKEDDFCKIDGWYPIATDRIVRPEKIEHYIEIGLLRRVIKQ
jgi:hypothetical protein